MSKLQLIAQRLIHLIPVLLGISIVSFALLHLVPGDPIRALVGARASPELIEAMRAKYGLDQGMLQQYLSYMGNLLQGDLGQSLRYKKPVSELIGSFAGSTAFLIAYVISITVPLTILMSLLAARHKGGWLDKAIGLFSVLGMTIPVFWLALLMIKFFSLELNWFPVGGYGTGVAGHLHHLLLPAISMSVWLMPVLLRNLRAALIEEMDADYVIAGRSRGLPESYLFTHHILRNASLATLNLFGVMVTYLISGTVIVESIYAIPGLGTLMFNSILGRDYNVILGLTLFYAVASVAVTLIIDILSMILDPRIN
jgi:ABC-type dipeptide/oligopeptide/nickel transport system permease component